MNAALFRFIKSAYRQEPISSFIITVGAVDAVIGGVENSGSLFGFGVSLVGLALFLRLWQILRNEPEEIPEQVPERYLPPSSSRPQMPMLMAQKKHPPSL
jgi:hypothetical protein